MRFIDLTGQRFQRYLVKRYLDNSRWLCQCDCGNERNVAGWTLRAGRSRSCGCLGREEHIERETTHGMTGHPLHNVWKGIIRRCENKNDGAYPNYGGRGIRLCDRWRSDFQNFYDDMAPAYRQGLTVERIDNDGDYEPTNCTWIPKSKQSKNRRPYSQWKFKRDAHPAA